MAATALHLEGNLSRHLLNLVLVVLQVADQSFGPRQVGQVQLVYAHEQLDDFSGSTLVGGAASLALERVRMLHALADAEVGAESSAPEGSPAASQAPGATPIPARGSGSWHGLDQIEAVTTAEALEAEMAVEAAAEAEEAAAEEAVATRIANSPGRINIERGGAFLGLCPASSGAVPEEMEGEATPPRQPP